MRFTQLPLMNNARLELRPMTHEDLPHWYRYLNTPAVIEHTSWNLQSVADLQPFVWQAELATNDSQLRLALLFDGKLIGSAGFHTVQTINSSAEITYDLAPAYWGQGFATQVCQTLTSWAHQEVGLHRVQATVLTSNPRSPQVLQRCGYQYEGLLRGYRQVRGKPGDFAMYSHLSSDL